LLTLFEVLHGLLDDLAIDASNLIGVADEEAVIAERVDEARDASGVLGDAADRGVGEQTEVLRAGDAKARADVVAGLLLGQRRYAAAKADSLLELTQLGTVQRVQQLRLAHEQDLQELFGLGLEVREKPDLLDSAKVQVLRLIEDEHGVLASSAPLEQEIVQRD